MSTEAKVTHVVIVEPQALIRDALVALLAGAGFSTSTDSGGADHLLAVTVAERQPDVVLLNVDPANGAGMNIFQQLPTLTERWRTLVVTVDDPAMHARAIELGAMGIVTRDQPGAVLVKAIRKVDAGELWLDRTRTAGVVSRLARGRAARDDDPARSKVEALTRREREIVDLVAEGLKNKQIADRLSISEATVRNHLTSVLDKLDLDDRFELAVFAFRHGLVACPQTPAMLRMRSDWRK